MSAYKLNFDEIEEDEVTLLAIHSPLANFRLAYFLNQSLKTHFKLVKNEIEVIKNKAVFGFTQFEFFDKKHEKYWQLIDNKSISTGESNQNVDSLKFENITSTLYLIPDYKKVDFILKIDTACEKNEINNILKNISSIPQVTLTYLLPETIQKTKNNLLYKV